MIGRNLRKSRRRWRAIDKQNDSHLPAPAISRLSSLVELSCDDKGDNASWPGLPGFNADAV